MKIDSISVFFPAFNEEKNISATINNADKVLRSLGLKSYEIIVVNDGSTDGTADIVAQLMEKNRHLRLISHEKNKGYGGALKTGFNSARYSWVAFADSDGQFDFGEIVKFISLSDSADLILGYRMERADSFMRNLYTIGWGLIARILLNLTVRDYSCAFKLIKKEVLEKVQPLQAEEKVTQIEMLVKAKNMGFKFAEVGVHHYPRKFGKQTGANIQIVIKSICDLLGLWWKLH